MPRVAVKRQNSKKMRQKSEKSGNFFKFKEVHPHYFSPLSQTTAIPEEKPYVRYNHRL
jgi:hypothetical protein